MAMTVVLATACGRVAFDRLDVAADAAPAVDVIDRRARHRARQNLIRIEKEDERMRRMLADAEARLAAQHRAHEDEPTNTGHRAADGVRRAPQRDRGVIESLRANMRAASDETAMVDQTEPVIAITDAVRQAAEHVERARDARAR